MNSRQCKLCGCHGEPLYTSLEDRIGGASGSWNLVRCSNSDCGLVWIDPVPDSAVLAQAYETYYTHIPTGSVSGLRRRYLDVRSNYIRRHFGYPSTERSGWMREPLELLTLLPHRRIGMDALAMWLPWKPEGRLLEIGCGNGYRLELLRNLGWQVSGIEPDAQAAKLASERGLNVSATALQPGSLPAGTYDAIIMSHVIEHVPDPQETIRECYRLLSPGGLLVMLTPNTDSLGLRWFGRNWLHLDAPRHLFLFNARNLSTLCRNAGFDSVRSVTTPRDADWTLGASLALRHQSRYVIGQLPFKIRILGLCLFYLEWLVLFARARCGEEVLVKAQHD